AGSESPFKMELPYLLGSTSPRLLSKPSGYNLMTYHNYDMSLGYGIGYPHQPDPLVMADL
ncbi:536_t:CDS:2, partial [Entrophospora sp. SA101]